MDKFNREENNSQELIISALSHDLRSPLSVINMLAGAIKNVLEEDKNNTEDAIKMSEMIMEKSSSMMFMLENLLKYCKMCSINPVIEEIDLNEIVNDCINQEMVLSEGRNVVTQKSALPCIMGDRILVKTVFANVISNAVKFTATREKAEITVTFTENEKYIIVSVKDNGVGFDMKNRDNLFGIFKRFHSSDEFEGTGVGLAIVDRIMKIHKGKVEAFGEEGKGAEFLLYFPKIK